MCKRAKILRKRIDSFYKEHGKAAPIEVFKEERHTERVWKFRSFTVRMVVTSCGDVSVRVHKKMYLASTYVHVENMVEDVLHDLRSRLRSPVTMDAVWESIQAAPPMSGVLLSRTDDSIRASFSTGYDGIVCVDSEFKVYIRDRGGFSCYYPSKTVSAITDMFFHAVRSVYRTASVGPRRGITPPSPFELLPDLPSATASEPTWDRTRQYVHPNRTHTPSYVSPSAPVRMVVDDED